MCNFVKIYGNIFLVYVKLILPKRKNKDFQQEKLNKCWKLHLIIPPCIDVTHFLKFFVSLEVTNSHLFRFAFIAFACNIKNFATAIIFFSLFFSTIIWMDWRKLLIELSKFAKLHECGLIQTHWRNVTWEMFIAI